MAESELTRAENRVREMEALAQQYVRQGNRYMQNMQNANQTPHNNQNSRHVQNNNNAMNNNIAQPRFEPVNNTNMQNNNMRNMKSNNMYRGSNRNMQQNHTYNNPQPQKEQPVQEPVYEDVTRENEHHNSNGINIGMLDKIKSALPFDINIENDKLIIIALIVLLSGEHADMKLIIALAYLIM